jgi:hypothetical protein
MNEGADRLLGKLRAFVDSCDDHERAMLALLLAPGLGEVYAESDADDVRGYAMGSPVNMDEWLSPSLSDALAAALRRRR